MADGIPITPVTNYRWQKYSSKHRNNSIMNDIQTLRVRKASSPSMQSLKTLYFNSDCSSVEERPYSGKLKNESVTKKYLKTHEIRRSNVTSEEYTQGPHIVKGCLSITSKKCVMPEVIDRAVVEDNRNTKRNSDSFLTRFVNVSTDVFIKLVINTIAVYYNILPTEHENIRIPRSLPRMQTQLRMNRRPMIASQESCCCTCDSDVLFKIIKGIYDCYKSNKKYTKDNLKCDLRDHLTEQQRLDKANKSIEEGHIVDKKSNVSTTLSVKARARKGNVLKQLENLDIGITISEKELIEKLRSPRSLPEPTTAEKKEDRGEAANISILQSIEEKNKIEKDNKDSELELPVRKSLIDKIKVGSNQLDLQKMRVAQATGSRTTLDSKTPKPLEKILSQKGKTHLKESKIPKNKCGVKVFSGFPADKMAKSGEFFLTSLDDNTLEVKESIIRGLALSGMALPKGRTMSERKLINKIRNELGLPLKPKTAEVKRNDSKTETAGLITSLEGKSNTQKDKLFQNSGEIGMSSPERRTRMPKALIKKTQGGVALEPPTAIFTSVKRSQSKTADFITSSDSKQRKQKEITVEAIRLPLSEENTSQKKKKEKKKKRHTLFPKSRNVIGSQKDTKTQTTASFTPSEARGQTKKIQRELEKLGIPIPENGDVAKPVLLKSKAINDKIIEQREKILQELDLNKLLLAKGWTEREKQLIGNIRNEICLPSQPTTGTVKNQLITPLRKKSPPPKIKLFPVLKEMGMPLPEYTIPSEKAHINTFKSSVNIVPLMPGFQRDKLANAKLASLKTGAKSEQKERILHALAVICMPLSEGTTSSERKLIAKIKKKLGLPPGPKADAKKNIYAKAQAAGFITPLEGKTTEKKAKILKKMAGSGISLPGGRIASERARIRKLK